MKRFFAISLFLLPLVFSGCGEDPSENSSSASGCRMQSPIALGTNDPKKLGTDHLNFTALELDKIPSSLPDPSLASKLELHAFQIFMESPSGKSVGTGHFGGRLTSRGSGWSKGHANVYAVTANLGYHDTQVDNVYTYSSVFKERLPGEKSDRVTTFTMTFQDNKLVGMEITYPVESGGVFLQNETACVKKATLK